MIYIKEKKVYIISFVYIYFACFAIFRFGAQNKIRWSYKNKMH